MPRLKTEGRSDIILDAALSLFAKYGFSKTTIMDIAQKAGVASGTIYLYYENKEEILKACALRFHQKHKEFAQILLSSKNSPSTLSPKLKLKKYLINRYSLWIKETSPSTPGTDLAQAMVNIAPEINKAEAELWFNTLKTILKEGEDQKIYHFKSLNKELKVFLHCLIGFFPLPGTSHPASPTEQDLLDAIEWFDKKWRTQ